MATTEASLVSILPSLTSSLESAIAALPSAESVSAPENGITLLDAKNEIFLSYLQALALRNLTVIRSVRKHLPSQEDEDEDSEVATSSQTLDDQIVRNLVQHRVYLEKGVRPLEERLKYQIDKVVRAADDEARADAQKSATAPTMNGHANGNDHGLDDSSDDSDSDDNDDVSNAADRKKPAAADINELSYRPNPNAFSRPTAASAAAAASSHSASASARTGDSGVYRPPRITATSMPTTEKREKRDRRPTKSATLDEYISSELATAPMAQPSIGSTIEAGGRRNKSSRERADEAERREYEETNLVRLPPPGKKVKGKKGRDQRGGYGGEEWTGLGEGLDRIGRLTKGKSGGGALERSRKRRATEDGPRGDGGEAAGGAFDRRKKKVLKRMK